MFQSSGTLNYDYSWKINLKADDDIAKLYRSLVPPSQICRPQRYPAHLTVTRLVIPPHAKLFWMKYEGMTFSFDYDPYIRYNGVYWWLNCQSQQLRDIREELGLSSTSGMFRPPTEEDCFHMTIGNSKK